VEFGVWLPQLDSISGTSQKEAAWPGVEMPQIRRSVELVRRTGTSSWNVEQHIQIAI
jgi:hypothetical protein